MAIKITEGIKISVEAYYNEQHSRPLESRYFYTYLIKIRNESLYTVQLMRRHWYILDSNGIMREVEGDGVVGKQPILLSGEEHIYDSFSHFLTDIGKMWGFFTFVRQVDGSTIRVEIPEFLLCPPFKNN